MCFECVLAHQACVLACHANDLVQHRCVLARYGCGFDHHTCAMGHKECVLVQHDVFCAFMHEFLAHLVADFGPYTCNGREPTIWPHSPVGRAAGCYR